MDGECGLDELEELILGNLFLNKLEDYSIGKNGIEIIYKGETCFIPKV